MWAVSSDLSMDYAVVGRTTYLAERMIQLASPGSILLTPSTLALVGGDVSVRPFGPVLVDGSAAAVEVYELLGAARADPPAESASRAEGG